jgi:hypothetical protein
MWGGKRNEEVITMEGVIRKKTKEIRLGNEIIVFENV